MRAPAIFFPKQQEVCSDDGVIDLQRIESVRFSRRGAMTYCSLAAKENLHFLTGLPKQRERFTQEFIPEGDAISLIQDLSKQSLLLLLPQEESEIKQLLMTLAQQQYSDTDIPVVFDMYRHTAKNGKNRSSWYMQGHRAVAFFVGKELYVLDPVLQEKKPLLWKDYVHMFGNSGEWYVSEFVYQLSRKSCPSARGGKIAMTYPKKNSVATDDNKPFSLDVVTIDYLHKQRKLLFIEQDPSLVLSNSYVLVTDNIFFQKDNTTIIGISSGTKLSSAQAYKSINAIDLLSLGTTRVEASKPIRLRSKNSIVLQNAVIASGTKKLSSVFQESIGCSSENTINRDYFPRGYTTSCLF